MKKALSLILILVLTAVSFPVGSWATDASSCDGIVPEETVITVPGLKNSYSFLQVSDTHYSILPEDTSTPVYSYAFQRRNHFNSYTEGEYTDTLQKFYDFARDKNCNALIMTGDMIDCPSDENYEFFMNTVEKNSDVETMFTLGNHDWTFPDASYGYGPCFSSDQLNILQPKFFDLCCEEGCGNTSNAAGSYIDFGEVVVVMLNNSVDYFPSTKGYTILQNALSLNKPTIVCFHVPLYCETITSDVIEMWNYNCIVGSHRGGTYWPTVTQYIVRMLETNPNIVGIFSAHVHFGKSGIPYDPSFDLASLPSNGALQYTCPPGYDGGCRLITIKGTDENCIHSFETEVINEPVCNVRAINESKCTKCGYVCHELGEYADHKYNRTVVTEPTCTQRGRAKFICVGCKKSYYESISELGHSYRLSEILTEPTYMHVGYGKYTCSECSAFEIMEIPKLEQVFGDADLDGIVSSSDLLYAEKLMLGEIEPDETALFSCDINRDGRFTSKDIFCIEMILSGNLTSYDEL